MELIKHTEYIYEYQNFINEIDCDNIVSLIESLNIPDEVVNESKTNVRNNKSISLTFARNAHSNLMIADDLCNQIFSLGHNQYCQDNKLIQFILTRHKIVSFKSKYTYRFYTKNEYYDWHIDDDEGLHNVISYLLYLNEDYDGGKLLFLNDKFSIKPKKGSLVCFPCGFQWIHKSSKINTGVKKIIWSCFYKGEKHV